MHSFAATLPALILRLEEDMLAPARQAGNAIWGQRCATKHSRQLSGLAKKRIAACSTQVSNQGSRCPVERQFLGRLFGLPACSCWACAEADPAWIG